MAQAQPGNAEVKPPRPPNPVLQVQNLPPELDAILLAWSQESAKVQKLQGEHHRFVYDTVFGTEKRAEGVFYYEAPGKGRIDLRPTQIAKKEVSKRKMQDGVVFKLEADRAERWICDGTDIWQVNDETKQVDAFPIPQENQGQNIMDGPMPFLFGMPPAKAKMRYMLKLLQENEQQAVIEVHPRLQLDAANWKKATVILDKALYLPRAVQLINPAGTTETVYTFGQFQVNKPDPNWVVVAFGGEDKDPFRPALKGYKFKVHTPPDPAAQQAEQTLPSVQGLTWKEAKELLEQLGCKVQLVKGAKAREAKLNYRVANQNPAPKTALKEGLPVTLTIYDVGPVPSIVGQHWKAAGQTLEEAGYKVKYLPGKVTTDEKQLYMVYQQTPAAGEQADYGSEVTLTVYNKPETAAN